MENEIHEFVKIETISSKSKQMNILCCISCYNQLIHHYDTKTMTKIQYMKKMGQ